MRAGGDPSAPPATSSPAEPLAFREYSLEGPRNAPAATHGRGPPRRDSFSDLYAGLRGFPDATPDASVDTSPPVDASETKNRNFWTVEYYQKYFDVTTEDVVRRTLRSVIPKGTTVARFDETLAVRPDLYGPFWISITLIFAVAVSGNVANYLQHAGSGYRWKYDFHLVSGAATAIFCYAWILPVALWTALKWTTDDPTEGQTGEKSTPSMISLFCLYGYSLAVYVPVSVLWTVQVSWFQWALVIAAASLSGSVLVCTLSPALKRSKRCYSLGTCILAFHFLLAAGFMLYFFHVPAAEIAHELHDTASHMMKDEKT